MWREKKNKKCKRTKKMTLKRKRCEEFCCICLDKIKVKKNICILPCNHKFHDVCLQLWMLEKNSCPICRSIDTKCNHYRKEEKKTSNPHRKKVLNLMIENQKKTLEEMKKERQLLADLNLAMRFSSNPFFYFAGFI